MILTIIFNIISRFCVGAILGSTIGVYVSYRNGNSFIESFLRGITFGFIK